MNPDFLRGVIEMAAGLRSLIILPDKIRFSTPELQLLAAQNPVFFKIQLVADRTFKSGVTHGSLSLHVALHIFSNLLFI